MGNWKKIITSGSNADLLNITSSGGIQIGGLTAGGASDLVLVRNTSTGNIETREQEDIGDLGSSINAFLTIDASTGTDPVADISNDTLNFVASDNITITGDSSAKSLTFSATTKSAADITTILSASLTSGEHQNITINEYTSGVFSLTGSQNLLVADTVGQQGIDLTYNSANNSLTASLGGLTTGSSVKFADITATGNISASGFISASALDVSKSAHIGGNLELDGNFLFDGFNFETSDLLNHSGSNVFGSGSGVEPSELFHSFTGSISVTGSGITLVDGVFTGDGSGLTNLAAAALPAGLLSSSFQIASDISGAFSTDQVTLQTQSNTSGLISAITAAPSSTNNGLSTGAQIFSFVNSATQSLSQSVSNNYITEIEATSNGGLFVSNGTSGTALISLNLNNLTTNGAGISPAVDDEIAFYDTSIGSTKKATIAALAAIITASSAGTVTNVVAGDGLTGGGSPTPTLDVGAGANISVTADGVGLATTINNITSITATTGSFGKLTVTGDTTILNTETVSTADNFILLNSNLNNETEPDQDAGISINRGSSGDANLFWAEDLTGAGNNVGRFAVSIENIASDGTSATHNHFLTSVSSSAVAPSSNPTFGDTSGTGNMHIDTATGDIWMYV